MRRPEFIAAVSSAAMSRVAARSASASYELAIFSLSEPSAPMNERSEAAARQGDRCPC
jgi:hypothetical protein